MAHHNPLMLASGPPVLGLIGAPSYRRKEAECIERAKYWLNKIELTDRADDPAGELPYGPPSAASKLRAPRAPIRCCFASTSRPPD